MQAEALDAAIREALPEAAVLTAQPAPVSTDWAIDLLHRLYGLSGQLEPLSGERDANFLFTPSHGGRRCMFKLSHPDEPLVVTDFQTQALLHMAVSDSALPVQRLVPDQQGRHAVTVSDAQGRSRVARLFSYLEGLPMPQSPRSGPQRRSVARMLARMDQALSGLVHPAAQQELPWDIQRAERVRPLLQHVPDRQRRALAEAALDGFERRAKPQLPNLRRQPIHNDFNLYNLLVAPDDVTQVSGILDFGDMVHAPLVNDVAVAASYHLDQETDPLMTMATFAADYHAKSPLTSDETAVLLDLVRARLAMVVAISGWRAARQPENAAYLMRNNAVSWARLAACADLQADQVQAAVHAACRVSKDTHE